MEGGGQSEVWPAPVGKGVARKGFPGLEVSPERAVSMGRGRHRQQQANMKKAELQRKGYLEKPGACWGSTFQSGGHRSSERLSNLSQVTQLDKHRSRVETRLPA